jgi:XTP/dITP diphosphohydrolase
MPSPALLVLGTANRKKAIELVDLLVPLGFEIKSLADFPQALSVEETGDTFAANATLKATEQARHLGAWVLGEDSGLSVDALGGRPGVYSARYSGPGATDTTNNARLLTELAAMPIERRTAHFACYAALSDPTGTLRAESHGRCNGRIRFEASGSGGFGYDPLFEIVEFHRTFGELGGEIKAVLSHRARAISAMIPRLAELHDSGAWS